VGSNVLSNDLSRRFPAMIRFLEHRIADLIPGQLGGKNPVRKVPQTNEMNETFRNRCALFLI
jgi:hypothetical protein